MKRIRFAAIILVVGAAVAIGIPWYAKSASAVPSSGIATSGFIEAIDVNLSPEVSGRIVAISASEGDSIEAGRPVIMLDASLLSVQKRQAEVNLSLAQANLKQSSLAKDGAERAWVNARDVLLKIAQANLDEANNTFTKITYPYTYSTFAFDVPTAVAAINDAQRQLNQAQTWLKEGPSSDNYAQAWDQFTKALDNLIKAQERLLRGQGIDVFLAQGIPTSDFWTLRTAQLEMNKAELAVQGASFAIDQAYTAYQQAANGIDIAQKQVDQSQLAIDLINVQINKLTVNSPISGTIAAKNAEVGEIAQAGAPILLVTQLDNVTLSAYVPEKQIGLVKLGQNAQVSVDSYPDTTFTGQVTYISPRAIFTPANIQLKDEREKTVFTVKISLSNPDRKLKPGMPADITVITNP
jgi:HlyD family secretion protein